MKKLLLSIVALGFSVMANAQGYPDMVNVVVKNYTDFNLYFAPRYHLGFYDGADDNDFFGVPASNLGIPSWISDLDYQEEGDFEMVPPHTAVEFNNGNTGYGGYGFEPNSQALTFNTNNLVAYGNDNQFFHKYMKLSWIRFALSKSTLNNAPYGGGLAYDFDPSGMTQVSQYHYVDSNHELFRSYWPSTTQFTVNGVTVEAMFITTPLVNGETNHVHIVFYYP